MQFIIVSVNITPAIENFSKQNSLDCHIENIESWQKKNGGMFSFSNKGWLNTSKIFFNFELTNMRNCYWGMHHNEISFLETMKKNYGFSDLCLEVPNCNSYYKIQDWDGINPWIDMIQPKNNKFLEDLFNTVLGVIECAEKTAKETGSIL